LRRALAALIISVFVLYSPGAADDSTVRIGLIHSEDNGIIRAADLAVREINSLGGILNKNIKLICRETASSGEQSRQSVIDLIEMDRVDIIIAAVNDDITYQAAKICTEHSIPLFAISAYDNSLTGINADKYFFRECHNSWMAARALGDYLIANYNGARLMYISCDNIPGMTSEAALRQCSGSLDPGIHPGLLIKTGSDDFDYIRRSVLVNNPDILILNLFGNDLITTIRHLNDSGIESEIPIIVPHLNPESLSASETAMTPDLIWTVSWCPDAANKYDYPRGIKFIEDYRRQYRSWPAQTAALVYSTIYRFRDGLEEAESFESDDLITAFEGSEFLFLKDTEVLRDFDHQSVQSVYVVRGAKPDEIPDMSSEKVYPIVLHKIAGYDAARSREEWEALRKAHNLTISLEDE